MSKNVCPYRYSVYKSRQEFLDIQYIIKTLNMFFLIIEDNFLPKSDIKWQKIRNVSELCSKHFYLEIHSRNARKIFCSAAASTF